MGCLRRAVRRLGSPVLTLVACLWTAGTFGHEIDSALLSLKEVEPGTFVVYWHASSRTLQDNLGAAVKFPATCRVRAEHLDCGTSGLAGMVEFPWLEGTLTRVAVDVQWLDGSHLVRMASARAPAIRVYGPAATRWRLLGILARDYGALGVDHILTGFDHIFFIVALALLVQRRAQLIATITAFTLAHSASLALMVTGLVQLAPAPVEACIALSILFVCRECLRTEASLTRRMPWAIALTFGLLHGLGFAAGLLDLGVPEQHVVSALLFFNVGVELGQLAILATLAAARALVPRTIAERTWGRRALVYAMGSLATYWTLERIGVLLSRLSGT